MKQNYFLSKLAFAFVVESPSQFYDFHLERNIMDTLEVLRVSPGESQVRRVLSERQRRRMISQRFEFEDLDNVYRGGTQYVTRSRLGFEQPDEQLVETLSDWLRLWMLADRNSIELPIIENGERRARIDEDIHSNWSHLTLLQSPEAIQAGPDLEKIGPRLATHSE